MKNKTITVKASYGDEEYQGAVQTLIYKILDIGEDYLLLAIDGKETKFLPAFTNTVVAADGTKITDISEINNIPITNLVFDSLSF